LGHPADQVLDVLRPNLLYENNKSDVVCDVCQRAKQTREPFPLSDHVSTDISELVHLDLWGPYKLSNLNFFDFDHLDDHPDIPNDEERSDPSPNRYGTHSPYSGSTFESLDENEEGHSQGSNTVASKDEKSANYEDNQNIISEGSGPLFSSQDNHDVFETQNLRRSSRPFVFSKNYNDFVVESKVKYGLEKYVNYSHLSKDNFCFTSILNKSFEPKSFEEASKHQHWIDAINFEMDALYRNNTWELVVLPKGRKAIGPKWV
ncbi:ribonuclease H-like domain-containing protein, partial [Tanacetum coccineum]